MHAASISPLFTDLYEITMAAAYHASGLDAEATFSVFVREPPQRRYFVAAGLEDLISALEGFAFSPSDLDELSRTGLFSPAFLSRLETLSFSGTVMAMPEGTVFFPEEPILEITAPILQAQWVETLVLNALGPPTLIATKAARCVKAAGGRPLVDFSMRRTHGRDAAMTVARSAYLAGFAGTSNVLAGRRYGIPTSGTMAHSFVMAFGSELEAFMAYADAFPDSTVLLIDTYAVESGARNAVRVARHLDGRGHRLAGIRLDSGDLAVQSALVRGILDEAGFTDVRIYASNDLDEFAIAGLIDRGAPIDAFGVGTRMGVSADRPFLDIVYKLVSIDGRGVRKRSPGKGTVAGAKQVFRRMSPDGRMSEDIIGCRGETIDGAVPLLAPVMEGGRRTAAEASLDAIRKRAAAGLSALPDAVADVNRPNRFPVSLSRRLQAEQP